MFTSRFQTRGLIRPKRWGWHTSSCPVARAAECRACTGRCSTRCLLRTPGSPAPCVSNHSIPPVYTEVVVRIRWEEHSGCGLRRQPPTQGRELRVSLWPNWEIQSCGYHPSDIWVLNTGGKEPRTV